MSENELAQYSFIVNKLIIGSLKVNEIINDTKSFGDKQGIRHDERVSTSIMVAPKFANSTTQEPKVKLVISTATGKSVVMSKPISSSMVITSPKASSF